MGLDFDFMVLNFECYTLICMFVSSVSMCQQKQFPDVLQNRCSWKFHDILEETPMLLLQSLFNKVAGHRSTTLLKKTATQGFSWNFSWWQCSFFKWYLQEITWWFISIHQSCKWRICAICAKLNVRLLDINLKFVLEGLSSILNTLRNCFYKFM